MTTSDLSGFERFLERVNVVARAAVTWITLAGTVVSLLMAEIANTFGVESDAYVALARVSVWIATAVAIIRRVTPVPAAERGVLDE